MDKPDLAAIRKRYDDSFNNSTPWIVDFGAFISNTRQDIPTLLDYIKELHREIHALESTLGSNFAEELRAKARLQAVNFSIDNNGCGGELTNDDWCKFCFMRPYCEERKS